MTALFLSGFLSGLLLSAGVMALIWLQREARRDDAQEALRRDLRRLEGLGQLTTGHF